MLWSNLNKGFDMQTEDMTLVECATEVLKRIQSLQESYPQPMHYPLLMARRGLPFSEAVDHVRQALSLLEDKIEVEVEVGPSPDDKPTYLHVEALRESLILKNGERELSLGDAYALINPYCQRRDEGDALVIFNNLSHSQCPRNDFDKLFRLIGVKNLPNETKPHDEFHCPDFGFGDQQELTTEIYSRAAQAFFTVAEGQFRKLIGDPIEAKSNFEKAVADARAFGGYGGRCNPVSLDNLQTDMRNAFPGACRLAAREEFLSLITTNFVGMRTNPSDHKLIRLLDAAGVTDPIEVLHPKEQIGEHQLTPEECLKRLQTTLHTFGSAPSGRPGYR